MTDDAATPIGDDSVRPFQLDALNVRGRVARLDQTLETILTQHAYPPSVCALIGEAALLTAMIGDALKLRGRFSLQARGDGVVSLVAADYFAPKAEGDPAHLRAYAYFDRENTPHTTGDPGALLGEGLFALTVDQGAHMQPYQGLTPLGRGGLSAAAAAYFAQSEQIATQFKTAIGQLSGASGPPAWRAGGVMIQHLAEPGEAAQPPDAPSGEDGLMSAQDVADMTDAADDWRRAALLLETAETMELIGPDVSPEALLIRLFHEVGPRVYSPQKVGFGCTCNRETVEGVLANYDAETLAEMTDEAGEIVVDCQFCGAKYVFDQKERT